MKLEEVRKLTLTFNSNKSLPVCGLGPNAWAFKLFSAEQTKHIAHLAFSYFINGSSFSDFSISQNLLIPHLSVLMLIPIALSDEVTLRSSATACCGGYVGDCPGKRACRTLCSCQAAKTKYIFSSIPSFTTHQGWKDTLKQVNIPEKTATQLTW